MAGVAWAHAGAARVDSFAWQGHRTASYAGCVDEFDELQSHLTRVWPAITLRTTEPQLRTVIVVHSIPTDIVPAHLLPVLPAYEERFLAIVPSLLRSPGSRVVYVTSQPVLPRVIDYWLGLVPGLDVEDVRSRLFLISPVDGSPRALTDKLLNRPRLLERIRRLVVDPHLAIIVPFVCRENEARLALELGIPVYGAHPRLWPLGGKSRSRRLFRDEGVPCADGAEDVRSLDDLVEALVELRHRRPDVRRAMVKHDQSVSGYGNAVLDLSAADHGPDAVRRAIDAMQLEDPGATHDGYLDALRDGAAVEEVLVGEEVRSPSVQLRNSPTGEVEVLSTHDQVLGGPNGLSFLGCRFPADAAYGPQIASHARRVGARLAAEGVVGRYGLDFVVVRDGAGPWRAHAVEVNLRAGGTTHTFMALQTLTGGVFDPDTGEFRDVHDRPRHYTATDHLENPAYASLTPDDLFDILAERHIGWDERTMTGVAMHMASAIAVAGRTGATAIASTPGHADALLAAVGHALDVESRGRSRSLG